MVQSSQLLLQVEKGPLPTDTLLLVAIAVGFIMLFVFGFLYVLSQ